MRFLAAVGLAGLVWGGFAQAATPMVVTYPTWMRAGPSPWAKELDELGAGWPVSVVGCADAWCQVESDRALGYLPQSVLMAGPPTPTHPVEGGDCFAGTHQTPERAIPLRLCPAAVGRP